MIQADDAQERKNLRAGGLPHGEKAPAGRSSWVCAREFLVPPIDVFHREADTAAAVAVRLRHPDSCRNYHMLARGKVTLTKEEIAAAPCILQITADDYYKVYVNGEFVGQGPAPSYAEAYNYNEYEVTKLLRPGENVIAVHCYYQGLINRVWNSGDMRQGLWARVVQDARPRGENAAPESLGREKKAGRKERVICAADETWVYCRAPEYLKADTTGYETQYLENIDVRRLLRGWTLPGFDDSGWEPVCVKEDDDHVLCRQETAVLQVYEKRPERIVRFDPGNYLLDFGTEIAAGIRFCGRGRAGEQVRILAGEELCGDGHVRWQMRCNCRYEETWILSGEEDRIENYDYKAFRYVEICCGDGRCGPAPECWSAVVRHYPFERVTKLTGCGDGRLLGVWEICARSIQMGTQEVFVDCPGREKGQYLGDLAITAGNQMYLTGDGRMYRKALLDFARSAKAAPGLLAVAPGSLMQEIADYSLMYPFQVVRYLRYTWDRETAERLYPAVRGILAHFRRFQRADGLLEQVNDKWNLVDWPENLRDSYDFPLTIPIGPGCHNVINAYFYGSLTETARLERLLLLDAEETEKEAARVKAAFHSAFYDREMGLFTDSEGSRHSSLHANGIALFFGLEPEEARERIVRFISEKGLCCGVYTAYYVLAGFARAGYPQQMYDLMMNEGEHSWMNMLREGATTCYEAWGREQKWNTSLCHPWGSAPVLLLLEELLGVEFAEETGELILHPRLPDQLKELRLRLRRQDTVWDICVCDGAITVQRQE